MPYFDIIASTIKKEIETLENNSKNKKATIESTYQKAIDAATEKRKEELKQLDAEKSDLKRLKKLYKDTTGKDYTSDKAAVTEDKPEVVSKTSKEVKLVSKFEDAKGNKAKILFALNEIKSGTNDAIINKLFTYDSETKGKTVNLELSQLYKAGTIKVIGKEGKKNIYSV